MAHPIREIGRMTVRTTQLGSSGGGGGKVDKFEVAAALAMRHPDTGKKLPDEACCLARLLYADDKSSRFSVKSAAIQYAIHHTNVKCKVEVARLVNCALIEIQSPIMRLNRKTGEQEVKPVSKSEICRRLGIKGNKLPVKIEEAYNTILQKLFTWNDMALRHVKSSMREDEAA